MKDYEPLSGQIGLFNTQYDQFSEVLWFVFNLYISSLSAVLYLHVGEYFCFVIRDFSLQVEKMISNCIDNMNWVL